MSNSFFNFNLVACLLSEKLGASQIYTRGPTPPGRPLAEKFLNLMRVLTIFNCVFNFNILALVVFEILGGLKFRLGGPVPLCTPPSGKIFVPEASTLLCVMAFSISTF